MTAAKRVVGMDQAHAAEVASSPDMVAPGAMRPARTALERCLAHVALINGRPISDALFEEALRPDEEGGWLKGPLRAAQAAGYEIGFGPVRLSDLDPTLLPAVLLPQSGAVVVEGREKRKPESNKAR